MDKIPLIKLENKENDELIIDLKILNINDFYYFI